MTACDTHPDREAAIVTDDGDARCAACQLKAALQQETTTEGPRPRCPDCHSAKIHQRQSVRIGDADGHLYWCKECGHDFDEPYRKPAQQTLVTDGGTTNQDRCDLCGCGVEGDLHLTTDSHPHGPNLFVGDCCIDLEEPLSPFEAEVFELDEDELARTDGGVETVGRGEEPDRAWVLRADGSYHYKRTCHHVLRSAAEPTPVLLKHHPGYEEERCPNCWPGVGDSTPVIQTHGDAMERVTLRVPQTQNRKAKELARRGVYPSRSEVFRAGLRQELAKYDIEVDD